MQNLQQMDRIAPPVAPIHAACAPPAGVDMPNTTGLSPTSEQSVANILVKPDPESAASLMARAWDYSRSGKRDAAVVLLDLSLARADSNLPVSRIHWSYGWAMFNLQEYRCALAHFEAARVAEPEAQRWVAHTYAVTYWQLGEHERAVKWYDVAAKNEPACWASPRTAAVCAQHWQRQEQRALGELLTHWKAWRLGFSPSAGNLADPSAMPAAR